MTRSTDDLLNFVREHLDAFRLIQGIQYHTDLMSTIGRNIKTPCMIHGDDRFATLIIDPVRRTYQCMVPTCRGRKGGDLLQLYALWSGDSELGSALGAAKLTGLDLPRSLIQEAEAGLRTNLRSAVESGDWFTALASRLSLFLFGDCEGEEPEITVLLDGAARAASGGVGEEALAEAFRRTVEVCPDSASKTAFLMVAAFQLERFDALRDLASGFSVDTVVDSEHLPVIRTLLDYDDLMACEQARPFLLRLSEEELPSGDLERFRSVVEKLASEGGLETVEVESLSAALSRAGKGEMAKSVSLLHFESRLSLSGSYDREEVLGSADLALSLLEGTCDDEKGPQICCQVAEFSRSVGEIESALEWIDRGLESFGSSVVLLSLKGDLLSECGRLQDARVNLRDAAAEATRCGMHERAREIYESLSADDPSDFETSDRYLDFLLGSGETEHAARMALSLASACQSAGHHDRAIAMGRRAAELSGNSHGTLRMVADLLYAEGDTEEGTRALIRAADLLVENNLVREAASCLAAAHEQDPGSAALLERLAEIHALEGRVEDSSREYAKASRLMEDCGETDEAIRILRKAAETCAAATEHLEQLCRILRERSDVDESRLDALALLLERAEGTQRTDVGLRACEEILELDPESRPALEFASREYERRGHVKASGQLALRMAALLRQENGVEATLWAERARSVLGESIDVLRVFAPLLLDAEDIEGYEACGRKLLALHVEAGSLRAAFSTLCDLAGKNCCREEDFDSFASGLNSVRPDGDVARIGLQAARSALKNGFTGAAEHLLNASGSRESNDPDVLSEAGELWLGTSRIETGAACLSRAALSYRSAGIKTKVSECLGRIIQAGGDCSIEALPLLAEVLVDEGRGGDAARTLRSAVRSRLLTPDQESALLRSLLALEPDDRESRRRLASLMAHEGSIREAIAEYLGLARTSLKEGDCHEALPDVLAARDLDAESPVIRALAADVQAGLGNDALAMREYRAAADSAMKQGCESEALEFLENAAALDPEDRETLMLLIQVCESLGDEEQADVYREMLPEEVTREGDDLPPEDADLQGETVLPAAREPVAGSSEANKKLAAMLILNEIDAEDGETDRESLLELLAGYTGLLQINPQNPGLYVKSAGIHERLLDIDNAVECLNTASEIFLKRNELQPCIDGCERILHLRPTDQHARNRLRQAMNKRDAFRALESRVLMPDDDSE